MKKTEKLKIKRRMGRPSVRKGALQCIPVRFYLSIEDLKVLKTAKEVGQIKSISTFCKDLVLKKAKQIIS